MFRCVVEYPEPDDGGTAHYTCNGPEETYERWVDDRPVGDIPKFIEEDTAK